MRERWLTPLVVAMLALAASSPAAILTETIDLTVPQDPAFDPEGLSARAIFTLDTSSPTLLQIELFNTSIGLPADFDNAGQLLTAISFDFGEKGYNSDPVITGGTVAIGPGGCSINFDQVPEQLGPGADVSGEWGYGNMDGSGLLANFISSCRAQATRLPGDNLDHLPSIDGPQAGICTAPPLVPLGGLGAIADSVIIRVTLDAPLADLDFLADNGVRVEFGSDRAFLIPEPASLAMLAAGGVLLTRRRKATL